MANHEDDSALDAHLARAWRGVTPPPELRERVRAGLVGSALATRGTTALAGGALGRALGTMRAPAATRAAPALRVKGTRRLGTKTTLAAGAALLSLGFLAGYWTGSTQTEPVDSQVRYSSGVELATIAPRDSIATPIGERPAAHESPAPEHPEEAPTGAPAAARGSGTQSHTPAPNGRQIPALPAGQPPPRTRAPTAPSGPSELDLLRRADRALRRDNAALALAFAAELDERYPKSALREERQAIRLMAACVLDEIGAQDRARLFQHLHPDSLYIHRISELCDPTSMQQSPDGR